MTDASKSTASNSTATNAETEDAAANATPGIVSWLEDNLGPVTEISRQPRWRPMWFATINRNGEELKVCVRADRTDTELTWPLDHEMRFQEVLTAHDIKSPKVHGWIEEHSVFVMEDVQGRPDFKGVGPEASSRIVDEYVDELIKVHSIDVDAFVAAGIRRAPEPDQSGAFGMARMEQVYREQKIRPNPFLEWAFGWLSRNPVQSQGREAGIVWDSGQFHHNGKNFVSLVDLELGHVGDPMMDLAGWRMRDSIIPFGNFGDIYERYGKLTGTPVDLEAIQLHHIAFTISNDLSFSHRLKDPIATTPFGTYLQWCAETNIYATEALGEYLDIELPTVEMPELRRSRFAAPYQHLARSLRNISADDEFVSYQLRLAFRVSQHLARVDEIGEAVVDADLDDVERLLGERPIDWEESETELERFVQNDKDGAHDVELLGLFHSRNLRAQMLNGPAGSAMARHNPIQRF